MRGRNKFITAPTGVTTATVIDGFTITNGTGTVAGSYRYGGGVYCSSSSPTITNNRIQYNSAYQGGGIYTSSGSPTIKNNKILSNMGGGVLTGSYSSAIVSNNDISGNGDVDRGGGIHCLASATLTNNVITNNSSKSTGGGIHLWNNPTVSNNTIAGNRSVYDGGGLCCYNSTAPLSNNIVAFNSSGIYRYGTGTPFLLNNCVYDNTSYDYSGISQGQYDISADPDFGDMAYGNLHIQANSPCRNAGDNSVVGAEWLDMDGQTRIQPEQGTVDIGADESDGTTWSAGPYVIVRVSTDGDDANDGSTWTLAKRTVQSAIDAASEIGGEVWVNAGTYNGCIALHSYVYLYGGFPASGNPSWGDRNWNTNVTVIDGQRGGSVVTVAGSENVSVIDGFTIRNGNGTAIGSWRYGGGIYSYGSPVIANCTITKNSADTGAGMYSYGGSPVIRNNAIITNISSGYGGGLYFALGSPIIVNNTVGGNTGNGIYCASCSPVITNNTIAGNGTENTGAGVYCYNSPATLSNNIVALNSSGIYKYGTATPVLKNNCVYGNTAYNYLDLPQGENDISVDPEFADPAYGNFHIQDDSLCRDAGDNSAVAAGSLDMDGQARVQPAEGTVDIGADESDGTTWPVGPYAIVHVSTEGNDANDGSTWALAKRTIQSAIFAASQSGGQVWVKAGTYNECVAFSSYVYLYGGFPTSGTPSWNDRDWETNITTIDGQQAGSAVSITSGYLDCTIDGFMICNGIGTLSGSNRYGGGIYSFGSPIITNNTITGNTANTGGGIYSARGLSVITKNIVKRNSAAGTGGGIYCYAGSATVSHNTITGNVASGSAGGIYSNTNSTIISNNVIAGNSASSGGGIYSASAYAIANNIVKGNSATNGGGIYCWSGSPKVMNNTVVGNNGRANGGGIYFYYSEAGISVANNIVAFNSSGMYRSYTTNSFSLQKNCVFGNTAYDYSRMPDHLTDISVDPLLADKAYGNLHIQANSPCRNAGDNSAVETGWLDIDGQARVQQEAVDIGADESDGTTTWPAGPYTVMHVSTEGDDGNDGSTWSLAKGTVQAAIDAASEAGGEVWVRAGTYAERIALLPYAYLHGGFPSTGNPTWEDRDWRTNVSMLDAQQAGSVVSITAGLGVSAIDGFTITNGLAASGGGIYSSLCSLPITNNTIIGNGATSNGGGIYFNYSPSTVANNMVTGNSATTNGGGVYSTGTQPTLTNNTITGNSATSGGGIYANSSGALIYNSVVAYNSSGMRLTGTATLKNNDAFGNTFYNYMGITDPTGSNGNILSAPLFVDKDGGDYHLTFGSPCVDTGDDSAVQTGWTDIDSEPRQVDIVSGGARVDIGADELHDYTSPTGSVVVNNGVEFTTSTNVTLSLLATDADSGVRQMHFSNDGSAWSEWEDYGANKSWSLTTGDGEKTIYAQFKDQAGNESVIVSDTIYLNSSPRKIYVRKRP